MPGKSTFLTSMMLHSWLNLICQNVSSFCRINTPRIYATLPTTVNNAINEHNDDSTERTFLFAHHAFRATCYYKWPNTPYNSTSFSRCPLLAWLPACSTLVIKISVIEHINYTHPETAMITISHVWMDYSHLPQNCRGRAMTLVKREGGERVVGGCWREWGGGCWGGS